MAESCKRELTIEVPAEAVRAAVDRVTLSFQRRARIPGFRPGKTPANLVRQRFSEDIRHDVLHDLVPEYFQRRVQEENLAPISGPEIDDVQLDLEGQQPLRFKASFEVVPSFELQDYIGLEIPFEEPTITDEEVEAGLKQLQENEATFVPIEGRPVEDGDFAVISMKGKATGGDAAAKPAVQLDSVYCEIGGADTLPAFTENLRGASPGDERTFPVSYPQDFNDARLAGRTLEYTVRVNEVKQKQVPELNDDFARDLGGEFTTLEQVRNNVRGKLLEEKRQHAEREAKDKLLERLAAIHNFPVPESLVEKQVQSRMERTVRRLAAQGLDPAKLDLDWTRVRSSQREEALRDVQASLILDRIAAREGLEVTEREVQQEIDRLAIQASRGKDTAAMRARLTKEGMADKIKSRLLSDKTLDFVYRQARKVAGRADAEVKP